MNLFLDAIAWLTSPDRLAGGNPIPERLLEHVGFTFLAVALAALVAVPVGYLIGHTGKGREVAVLLSGAARALPSLGLLYILTLLIGIGRSEIAATIVFVLLGVPSILAGAYAGIQAVDRRTVDAARAVGMTEWQILWKVEVPLGLPLLIGGLRSATLQITATAVLAAYVNLGGLGTYISRGIQLRDYAEMLGGAILIVLLALVLDGLFALAERAVVPAGVSGRRSRPRPAPAGAAA